MFDNSKGKNTVRINNSQYYKSMIEYRKDASIIIDSEGIILLSNEPVFNKLKFPVQEIEQVNIQNIFFAGSGQQNPLSKKPFRDFEHQLHARDAEGTMHDFIFNLKEIEGGYYLCTFKEPEGTEIKNVKVEATNPVEAKIPSPGKNVPTNDVKDNEAEARSALNNILGLATALGKETEINSNRKLKLYVDGIINSTNAIKKLFINGEENETEVNLAKASVLKLLFNVQVLNQDKASQNHVELSVPEDKDDIKVITDSKLLVNIISRLVTKAIVVSRSLIVKMDYHNDEKQNTHITIDNIGLEFPSEIINYIKNSEGVFNKEHFIFKSHPDFIQLFTEMDMLGARIDIIENNDGEQIVDLIIPGVNTGASTSMSGTSSMEKMMALVVEDNKMNAVVLNLLLEKQFKVSNAYSGNEALNIIERLFSKDIKFDIIFMDIGLPKPWDGISLKNEIVSRWPGYKNVSFIAQTAYATKTYSEKIKEAGFNYFLTKPLKKNELTNAIKTINNHL